MSGNQHLADRSQIDVRNPIVTSLARVFAEQSSALASRRTAKLSILTSIGADSGGPFSGFKSTITCWLNNYIFQYIPLVLGNTKYILYLVPSYCEFVKSVNSRRNLKSSQLHPLANFSVPSGQRLRADEKQER